MPVFGFVVLTDNVNKADWSPIQSLIIQDLLRSRPDSINQEYDYRQLDDTMSCYHCNRTAGCKSDSYMSQSF